jgi:hypothetical protein
VRIFLDPLSGKFYVKYKYLVWHLTFYVGGGAETVKCVSFGMNKNLCILLRSVNLDGRTCD